MRIPIQKTGCPTATLELMEELESIKRSQQLISYQSNQIGFTNMLISYYDTLKDKEKKFVLMKSIIYATIEIGVKKEIMNLWKNKIKDRIISDLEVHEYTVFSWSCFNENNFYGTTVICPHMCKIWQEMYVNHKNNHKANCNCVQAA